MEFKAPAKVNLYLKVLAKRPDGYHDIETVFEKISLFDIVSVEATSKKTVITSNDPNIPVDNSSIMMRAASLFRDRAGNGKNFKVHLEKNIPVSAGLGGGSSDTATLLKAMNELSGSPLDTNTLNEMGGSLGADIPFFLHNHSFAYGTGKGDIISGMESMVKIWHVLINPPISVSTKEVYSLVNPLGLTNHNGVGRMFGDFLSGRDTWDIAKNLHNDLQHITLGIFPVLGETLRELMTQGAQGAIMSGSGPTVFGIFEEKEAFSAKERLREKFPDRNWKIEVVTTYQPEIKE
ncbi:MAG: 4-(cytidine 5'-diphospho)-2-C-methyl-D-erythritol kinase [Candidatus Omnitrophica bacterium]|nr:4-(cytidine 5'-diphospho)-2-C-methyl-D-erythritol kinase [Candidatus Omnitrophota bacterium]